VPTAGCGTPATGPFEQWIEGALDVAGTMRRWWVRLPDNYDAQRAYPVVFLFHGCGNETNNVPMQNVIGDAAILVRGVAVEECWDTQRDTADVAFFDAMVQAVSQSHCVDSSRLFAAGYSSGSWLINLLECVRGDVLRAAGSVAGGTPYQPECVGTVARIFVHDQNDDENQIAGNIPERDRLLELNMCDTAAQPVAEDPAPCVRYQGCDPEHPVIWCATSGQGHDRQDDLAATAFWGLFTEF
jgi:poly(3-hydroxybutyrate) depolymerase